MNTVEKRRICSKCLVLFNDSEKIVIVSSGIGLGSYMHEACANSINN